MNETISKKSNRASRLGAVSVPAEVTLHVIVGLFCLLCIIPFIFVVIISFSSEASLREVGFSFIPAEWGVEGYSYVFKMKDQVIRSFFNSVFTTLIGTAASVLICSMYSYALFRSDFKFRRFFTFFSFVTMIFGGGLVPTYMVCKNILGLDNNYLALIVPLLVNPFNFIVMRTFFQSSVPEALIEAAAIDGSGEYRTLFQIIFPISLPGIATISLLNMLAYWNEWFSALLYTRAERLVPLQFLLMRLQSQIDFLARNSSRLGAEASILAANLPRDSMRMAVVVIIVIPIAFAYPFFQRYIISGLTIGSVKG